MITVDEQLTSWYTKRRRAKDRAQLAKAFRRMAEVVAALAGIPILDYTEPAINRFEDLKKQKLGVKGNDLRIAATCLEHGATVVTRNRRDFDCVPGLTVEDWSV